MRCHRTSRKMPLPVRAKLLPLLVNSCNIKDVLPIRLAQLSLHVVSGHVPARGDRAMARADFPRTLAEFQDRFASEEDCRRHLVACRWPDGFRCPRRGSRDAYEPAGHELGLTA